MPTRLRRPPETEGVLKDGDGKIRYQPAINFRDRETRTRSSAAVMEAMPRAHPEVFASEERAP